MLSAIHPFPEHQCICCNVEVRRRGFCDHCYIAGCDDFGDCEERARIAALPVCADCGASELVEETAWHQGIGRVTVRERCQRCIDREAAMYAALAAARVGRMYADELADAVGVNIAERVAREGRLLARATGRPGDYPEHVLARIRAEEEV